MAQVKDILAAKGGRLHVLAPGDMVLKALELMAQHNIGAVPVVEKGRLVGIFTERHYARDVFLKGRGSPDTPLADVMAHKVVTVAPEKSAEHCMAVMTDKRIRHLPVLDGGKLVGIISIGDLMKSIIADREFDIRQLVDYVRG